MNKALKRTFASLQVGEKATIERHISEEDVATFAAVSGDHNPLHMEEVFAKKTPYQHRVVHGMFLGGLVSQLVGMQLPGENALLMKETLEFKKPVLVGSTVVVTGTIVNKSESTHLIELAITIQCAGSMVATGSVHVKVLESNHAS